MNEFYTKNDLWDNGVGAPLVFLLPGATGTKRPEMKGFDAMAAMFWLNGYSAYIFTTSGQDGLPGEWSLKNCLKEARISLESLVAKLNPSQIVLFGGCAGGTIAGHLATELPFEKTSLILWESLFCYTSEDVQALADRINQTHEISLSPTYPDAIHLETVVKKIKCPVLVAYGTPVEKAPGRFCHTDAEKTINGLGTPFHQVEKYFVPGGVHGLVQGKDPVLLKEFIAVACKFLERHQP